MKPLAILVVEDVPEMGELLARAIRGMPGFQLSGLAKNGAEARIEISRRRPEVVLLDEVLPGESSLEILSECAREGIPVVLLTSQPDREEAPFAPGALGRILKPGWTSLSEDQSRISEQLFEYLRVAKNS